MNPRIKKLIGRKRVWLAAAVSVAILVVLVYKTDVRFDKIGAELHRANAAILAATLIFSALWHAFVGADKWWRILRAQGAPVGWWEVFRVRMGSDPIRLAAPLKVGEVVNAMYFSRLQSLGFSRAAGSIVFDKALNLFGTVFWLYVGLAAMAELPTAGMLALHTSVGLTVLVLIGVPWIRHLAVAIAGRIHAKLGRFAYGVLSAFEEFSWRQKFGFLVYGIVFQLRPLLVCGLLFVAFRPDRLPSVQEILAYGSIVVLMGNVPSLGVGPREMAVVALFSEYAGANTLTSVGLLMSVAIQFFPAIIGIPLMFPLLRSLASVSEERLQDIAAPECEQPSTSVACE